MVPIDLEVALRIDLQIEMPMPCDLRKHVIEKRNAGRDRVFARAIQVQADADIGFVRLPSLRRLS